MAEEGAREEGEMVSSTEGGFAHDTSSGPLLMRVVTSDCGNSRVKVGVPSDVVPEGPVFMMLFLSDSIMAERVEVLVISDDLVG